MPIHWESSKRPLFVRTVVVDGNRHAILSHQDPHIQTNQPACKPARTQSEGSSSSDSEGFTQEKAEGSKKGQRDLQSCIIKLRLVLTTQEKPKTLNSATTNHCLRQENKKRKIAAKKDNGKRTCDWHVDVEQSKEENSADLDSTNSNSDRACKLIHQNIAVAKFFASETFSIRDEHHHNELTAECEIISSSDQKEPIFDEPQQNGLNISSDFDIPWNSISADCYFTRPFYNRLSERVLQWIDHANKKQNSEKNPKVQHLNTESNTSSHRRNKKSSSHEASSDDNCDEVKQESDVDTLLSRELPKFSEELNRLHQLKAEIPLKDETNTKQLQDSIAESFTNVVSIRSGKYALPPKAINPPEKQELRKKGRLRRQQNLDESSDNEDEDTADNNDKKGSEEQLDTKCSLVDRKWSRLKQIPAQIQFSPRLPRKFSWLSETTNAPHWPIDLATPKRQLHIFIPATNGQSDSSDSESCE